MCCTKHSATGTAVCGLRMLTATYTLRSELVHLQGAARHGLSYWLLLETVGFCRPSCIFQISAASGGEGERAWCGFPVCIEASVPECSRAVGEPVARATG